MNAGLTAVVCCLIASLAACTSLDLPPALEGDEDGGGRSVVLGEAGTVGENTDDDQDADPSPPSAKVDAGLVAKDAGKQAPEPDASSQDKPATTPAADAGTATPSSTPDAGTSVPSSAPDASKPTPGPTPDAGTTPPVVRDAGATTPPVITDPVPTEPPVTVTKVVPGSAARAQCSSYGLVSGSMCGGYFCGVTLAQVAAEMPADTLCGADAAASTCDNRLTRAVTKCARQVKSAIENLNATNDVLRPKIQDCVLTDADLKARTPMVCLGCYLDAATCDNDNCLVDCLAGDSKGCDTCRVKNNCHTKAVLCAKLPNPF